MDKKQALSIAEEVLRILVSPNTHFQENMHEYICEKLDISGESLAETLDIVSGMATQPL